MKEKMKSKAVRLTFLILFTLTATAAWSQAVRVERKSGFITNGKNTQPFDVARHVIPLRQIKGGGPSRDAIPALNNPRSLTAEQAANLLRSSDRVLGVVFNGKAKAYPTRILNWHELVNDTVGRIPILVSW